MIYFTIKGKWYRWNIKRLLGGALFLALYGGLWWYMFERCFVELGI